MGYLNIFGRDKILYKQVKCNHIDMPFINSIEMCDSFMAYKKQTIY
jgi:hypothetical protein